MPIDEQVESAMRRWPQVPAVHGWLRLDRRGRWLLVDRGRPGFDETRDGAGSEITSPPIVDFIGRNYGADEAGRWYWQNGPQRVFVDLDLAPLVLRVVGEGLAARLVTHTGYPLDTPGTGWIDADGNVFLETAMGPGALHDLDLAGLEIEELQPHDGCARNDEPEQDAANPGGPGGKVTGLRLRVGTAWITLAPLGNQPDAQMRFVRRPRV
jgi:hypothetical protein